MAQLRRRGGGELIQIQAHEFFPAQPGREQHEHQGTICATVWPNAPLDLSPLMYKSATFAREFNFTRPMFQTADLGAQHEVLSCAATLLDSGVIRTTLTERLSPITAATLRQTHARVETGRVLGKIVVAYVPAAASGATTE